MIDNNEVTILPEFKNNTIPSAPASGISLFPIVKAGRKVIAQRTDRGFDILQSAFSQKNIAIHTVNWNITSSINGLGHPTWAQSGTLGLYSPSLSTPRQQLKRVSLATSATAGNSATGRNGSARMVTRQLGFDASIRFAIPPGNPATNIHYIGLCEQVTAMGGGTDPSTLTRLLGLCKDQADTTLQFVTSTTAGVSTKVDTGVMDTNAAYNLRVHCKPNDTVVYITLEEMSSGTTLEYVASTNLPDSTTWLTWQIMTGNGVNAAVSTIDYAGVVIETDF